MAPSSSSSTGTTSVQVALRVRPPTSQDSTSIPARFQRSVIQATSSNSVSIESPSNALVGAGAPAVANSAAAAPKKHSFSFDQVHPPPTSQYKLFESTARPLVSRFLEGFNCTILAYGQTSSGKTFTMTGLDLDADPSDANNGMGIIPRAVSSIFLGARKTKEERGSSWGYNLKASFIEIYNEDLIDLLSIDDPAGVRREVQIREDKEGHIIWGGLREVSVKNTYEVMSLLKKGTSFRQTNETEMNAQSSRSHAIFSLTLTQKKFTGSGHPPRSSSPLPPAGRSPSRLARPGSMYTSPVASGLASPTFGRPSTPSTFVSAIGRGGLRPASALGHQGERTSQAEDERGDWVTIVSKFHFVDLAGSERLKRTAAAGERIKEGISINSGLLALGNVISALGDPARSKTTIHVPYRDSKLTRLLQDSLGGNSHTLMIACVSPAEWNAGETINTLKYANRARNIKNRAILNEKEDGWEDVEWLQGTVSRLRKELKVLKDGGVIPVRKETEVVEGAGKKVLGQLTELQNSYEDLREKFVERTEELTRLRRELGEKHRHSSSGAVNSTAKYEEIVGPVIEEYEKTISAIEAELSLNRAALRHTNEMFQEKEEELTSITVRHAATESYVEELRVRVAKLAEREASTEAYVRDLEERLKSYDESNVSSSESLVDLKRELVRFKESEAHSSKYIADLEARLSRSDESILALQQNMEGLETECERRRDQAETLQQRLDNLTHDGDNWRTDLEAREVKVKGLEQKMFEWEQKRKEADETRSRLGEVVEEVVTAKRNVEIGILITNSTATPSPELSEKPLALPVDVNVQTDSLESNKEELEKQLLELQHTHTATLSDLTSISSKYRDALREISDLAAQIQEAKLNPTITELAEESETVRTESPTFDSILPDTPIRRKKLSPRIRDSEGPFSPTHRRHFFRQAASAESLHARSLSQSQSLSQELSSVHTRKTSSSAGSLHSRSNSHSVSHIILRSPLLISSSPTTSNERSVTSLEKEIMRLQEVLREREVEITLLERSLKDAQRPQTTHPIAINGVNGKIGSVEDAVDSPVSPEFEHLPPPSRSESIPKVVENGHADAASLSNDDESLERLNELMLSMAQKESHHKEVVDDLTSKLHQTRRQLDELTTLSRDQTLNMSLEIEALQKRHEDGFIKLESLQNRETQLVDALREAETSHSIAMEALRVQHEETLNIKSKEVEELMVSLKGEHNVKLSSLSNELEAATTSLQKAKLDHETALSRLVIEHEKTIQTKLAEANTALEETHSNHEKLVAKLQAEHVIVLRQKDEKASSILQTTEEEYYNALTKLRSDHAEAIRSIASETNSTIERLREEHAAELRMTEIAKEGSLTESESARALAIKNLQEEHAAAISRKDLAFAEEIESLNAGFVRASRAKDDDHSLQVDRLKLEHETTISKLESDWRAKLDQLNATISSKDEEHARVAIKLSQEKDAAIKTVQEQQRDVLQEIEKGHEADLLLMKEKHALALVSKVDKESSSLVESHTQETLEMKKKYEGDLGKLEAELASVQESQKQTNEQLIELHAQALADERSQFTTTLEDMQRRHQEDQAAVSKDRDALIHEIEAHKAAAEDSTKLREETRQAHETELEEKSRTISNVEQNVSTITNERDELASEVEQLRAELERTRNEQSKLVEEAHKRESLVMEVEHHRSTLADLQETLQKVKDEKDVLQTEKIRAESLVRELQAQLARSASPPHIRSPDRVHSYQRVNGLPVMKLPPLTPPPSVPPPPAPRSGISQHLTADSIVSTSSQMSTITTATTSSNPESPLTSVAHSPVNGLNGSNGLNGLNGFTPFEAKSTVKVEHQTKQIEEQEAMIKTLNKQLTHCESDLQTHMDLVTTLEASLGESEKNLRKARMQATELARERDTMSFKAEALRNELEQAKREVANVRRSIVEEKQSLEQRLDEERKAKERVRQQLDSRMDELQRRKSKFACL